MHQTIRSGSGALGGPCGNREGSRACFPVPPPPAIALSAPPELCPGVLQPPQFPPGGRTHPIISYWDCGSLRPGRDWSGHPGSQSLTTVVDRCGQRQQGLCSSLSSPVFKSLPQIRLLFHKVPLPVPHFPPLTTYHEIQSHEYFFLA